MITPRPVGEPQPNNDAVNNRRQISEPAADRPRKNDGYVVDLRCVVLVINNVQLEMRLNNGCTI